MKYWSELSRLETQIIRLEEMRSLFSVLASGVEESSAEDVRSALWYVEGSLTDIHQNLRSEFDALWGTVREEHFNELAEEDENKNDWKSLDEVTRKWAASSVE